MELRSSDDRRVEDSDDDDDDVFAFVACMYVSTHSHPQLAPLEMYLGRPRHRTKRIVKRRLISHRTKWMPGPMKVHRWSMGKTLYTWA